MSAAKFYGAVKKAWLLTVSLTFTVMFIIVLLQIFSRKVMNLPLLWSDELATTMFVWTIYIGSLMVLSENSMIRLDMLTNLFSDAMRRKLDKAFHLIFIATALLALPGAIRLTLSSVNFRFSLSGLPWAYLYLAGPVFFAFGIAVTVFLLVKKERP